MVLHDLSGHDESGEPLCNLNDFSFLELKIEIINAIIEQILYKGDATHGQYDGIEPATI